MVNGEDPVQMQHSVAKMRCLIWIYTVCKGLSVPIYRVITVLYFIKIPVSDAISVDPDQRLHFVVSKWGV